MKNRQWRYYLLYWLMVFFPAHYLGAQGIAYQSVEVDSLINPPLLKEGGEMFSFDSLRIHIGSIYDTDAPRTYTCLLYTSPSPRDPKTSRMPSSA